MRDVSCRISRPHFRRVSEFGTMRQHRATVAANRMVDHWGDVMTLGLPCDLTWYKLTDWGSFIGGLLALIAGGLAYLAGLYQAKATREAATSQIAAQQRSYEAETDVLRKSIALDLRQTAARTFGAHRALARVVTTSNRLTSRMVESSVNIPSPLVLPSVGDKISRLECEAIDVLGLFQLVDIGRVAVEQLLRDRTPDNLSLVRVAATTEAFLIAVEYAVAILPRLRTGRVEIDSKDDELARQVAEARAAWAATAAFQSLGARPAPAG